MPYFTTDELDDAAALVHRHMAPTPQYAWPLLSARAGCEVWVKHENHGPTGAFKVRGGITFIDWLRRTHPEAPGIITATRGNHGQSQARAAVAAGLRAVVYVPHGNSVEKNAAKGRDEPTGMWFCSACATLPANDGEAGACVHEGA